MSSSLIPHKLHTCLLSNDRLNKINIWKEKKSIHFSFNRSSESNPYWWFWDGGPTFWVGSRNLSCSSLWDEFSESAVLKVSTVMDAIHLIKSLWWFCFVFFLLFLMNLFSYFNFVTPGSYSRFKPSLICHIKVCLGKHSVISGHLFT